MKPFIHPEILRLSGETLSPIDITIQSRIPIRNINPSIPGLFQKNPWNHRVCLLTLPTIKLSLVRILPRLPQSVLRVGRPYKPEAAAISRSAETEADQPSILLEILDDDPDRRWSEDEFLMVEQVTDQLTIALENARLFEETRHARDALEVSVRYQKCVSDAVSILSERGISALSDVLQLLGAASQASRVYYLETQVDYRGPSWKLVSEWRMPDQASLIANPALGERTADWLKSWLKRLEEEGFISEIASSASIEARSLFDSLGVKSILHFLVARGHEAPGCVVFEQADVERIWADEEIAVLQTAASALSNTIVRENLFNQLQVNLSETDAQYQASAQLNSAGNPTEILTILRRFSILGHINASRVSIHVFDRPWTRQEKPGWLTELASWSAGIGDSTMDRLQISEWTNLEVLFSAEQPTLIFDLPGDPRLDPFVRSLFADAFGAKSLLSIPLNVSGRWIGEIIALFNPTTGFSEREIRRLVSLSGQAAVAVESLRLLDETKKRNEELLAMNQMTSAVSRTLNLDEVLGEILEKVLAIMDYESGLISYIDPVSGDLVLAVHQNLPQTLVERLNQNGLKGTPCDLVFQSCRTIAVPDITHLPENVLGVASLLPPAWPHDGVKPAFTGLLSLGFRSYLGVPLSSKGRPLGTVCVFSKLDRQVPSVRIPLIESIGQQVGVAIENARLFQKTQSALSETESLYQASSELNGVQNFDEILLSLSRQTVLGKADQLLSIILFEHPWVIRIEKGKTGPLPALQDTKRPEWLIPIAHKTCLPAEVLLERYELRRFPANRLLSASEPTIIEDVSTDERLDEAVRKLFKQDFRAQTVIFVPLFVGSQWIGFLFGAFSTTTHFSNDEIRRLTALSSQSAIAIQNIRLLDESRRRASQLQTAAEIARDTSGTLALDSLLQRTISLISERFGFYHASIFLLDEAGSEAVVRESTGSAGEEMKRSAHHLAVGGRSLIGQVTGTGKPLVLNDINTEQARQIHLPNPLLPLTRAELGIPLKIGERVIGALDVQSNRANSFTDDDISVLQILTDQIAVAVDNARSYEVAQTAVAEIREADRLKSQFLANMSHELRTPLNSIIGFSRVILKGIDGPVSEQQNQDLTAIYNSGQHLLGLINDVLDLSRIEAGKMDLAIERNINLAEIIRSVMSTTIGLIKDKPIRLEQHIDPDLPLVSADPMKIRQVLLNLLANAAKFTERGSIIVEASRTSSQEGDPQVLIRVIDTGPGIAQIDQARLFQPFSQVDGSLTRKTGGSGLGLSISSHLIRLHNGQIGLQSEIGKGSAFYIVLPVDQPEKSAFLLKSAPETPSVLDSAEVEIAAESKNPLQHPSIGNQNRPLFLWLKQPQPTKPFYQSFVNPGY